jgi:superoxide dismutase, Fe-Mn family
MGRMSATIGIMQTPARHDRRQFMKISALAATAAALPSVAGAATLEHALADLPYRYDALEPHIDARTMEIHHSRHHAAYVNNMKAALEGHAALAALSLDALQPALAGIDDKALQTTLRNNGGGHWNHDFFWKIMTPKSDIGQLSAELTGAIQSAFGGFDEFKKAFAAAGAGRFGSGWAWLIVKTDGTLAVTSTPNQDNPLMTGIVPDGETGTPILGVDVWEHAYYLHYQNRRADYLDAFWKVVDWQEISKRHAAARA